MIELTHPPTTLSSLQSRSNNYLARLLTRWEDVPARLHQAIHYVITAGGKRLRPLLVYSSGLAFGASLENLDPVASAVELIHTYSLVHDDLPAMDDDDLRRGKPTCHIQFDEATAILTGDALQCFAFELLANDDFGNINNESRLKLINTLCKASGGQGMAGGQMLDLQATGTPANLEALATIHRLKTGELIKASIIMGAQCAQIDATALCQLKQFADHIGLAYQIHDDILDIESTTEQLGKTQGADLALNKATYPSIVGLEKSKQLRDEQFQLALDNLSSIEQDCALLEALATKMISRNH